jgi:hypothetical protein
MSEKNGKEHRNRTLDRRTTLLGSTTLAAAQNGVDSNANQKATNGVARTSAKEHTLNRRNILLGGSTLAAASWPRSFSG